MSLMTASSLVAEYLCPYCDNETGICTASCSAMLIDSRMRMKYCGNEDYDDCPIFLVKILTGRWSPRQEDFTGNTTAIHS